MNTKLTLPEGDEKTKTVVVLEGKAPDPINKKGYAIAGNITAVSEFLSKRKETVNLKTSHIEVDLEEGTIVLIVDADSPLKLDVKAELYRPEHLKALNINGTSKPLQLREMGELLRMHRFLFADVSEEYPKVIKYLTNFSAKVETEVNQQRNTSNGSGKTSFEKNVTVDSITFKVKTPLYVGGVEKEFLVEICCDVSDGGSRFWLESLDLIELEKTARKEALDAELEKMKDSGLAIISK